MTYRFVALLIAGLATAAIGTAPCLAQDEAAGPGLARQGQEVITKVYSLRDLIHATAFQAPPAPQAQEVRGGGGGIGGGAGGAGGGNGGGGGGGGGFGGGGGGGAIAQQRDTADARAGEIIDLITSTVDPDSWTDNGGTLGTIDYVSWTRSVVVTHTRTTHDRIAALLAALKPDTRLVTLQVRLVELGAEALRDEVSMQEGASVFGGDVESLTARFTGRSTGFDGEPQTLSNAREISYIANLTPVVAQNAVGYHPTLAVAEDGVTIEATPELADDGASARLSLRGTSLRVQTPPRATTQPANVPGVDAVFWLVERPVIERQRIDTRLRLPVNTWVLVGTVGSVEAPDGQGSRPLYLLVRVDADEQAAE